MFKPSHEPKEVEPIAKLFSIAMREIAAAEGKSAVREAFELDRLDSLLIGNVEHPKAEEAITLLNETCEAINERTKTYAENVRRPDYQRWSELLMEEYEHHDCMEFEIHDECKYSQCRIARVVNGVRNNLIRRFQIPTMVAVYGVN